MAKINWGIANGATDVTSKVLSMTFKKGRQKYLDSYSGNSLILTINNSSNYATNFNFNNVITITANSISGINYKFWVQEITFNDYPGNTGLNTATIICADWISRAGRINASNISLTQNSTIAQLQQFLNVSGGPLPSDMDAIGLGSGSPNAFSTAIANTYTGTVTNYLNYLTATERGYILETDNYLYFVARSYIGTFAPITIKYGRTTSTTQIGYQRFERIQNGLQFINDATISNLPNVIANQNETNASSIATYGQASYSATTVDFSANQADGNASWIANNFSDPSSLRFICSFTDISQNATALTSWLNQSWATINPVGTISYQVPGGALTEINVITEGIEINVQPESTEFTMFFSPLQYYQFFTLNSTTLGILNTSRLGW